VSTNFFETWGFHGGENVGCDLLSVLHNNEGGMFLLNVGNHLQDCMASQSRKSQFTLDLPIKLFGKWSYEFQTLFQIANANNFLSVRMV
jgi:hypothetical protein